MDDLVNSNTRERNLEESELPKLRPLSTKPSSRQIDEFIEIPSTARYASMKQAIDIIKTVHGIDPLLIDGVQDQDLGARTEGGYLPDIKEKRGAFFFNTRRKIVQVAVIEEIAHAFDHQLFSYSNNWASESRESDISDVLAAIKESQTFQTVTNYKLGQNVRLVRGNQSLIKTIARQSDLTYEQDVKEWFARAYIQFIAITSGNEELVKEIAALRSTRTHTLLYPAAWADDEFEPIAQSFEALLRRKRWIK